METSISEEKHDRNIYLAVTKYLQKILMTTLFRSPIIEGSLCQEHSSFFRHRAMVHIKVPPCINAHTPIANHRWDITSIEASANCLIRVIVEGLGQTVRMHKYFLPCADHTHIIETLRMSGHFIQTPVLHVLSI